MRLGVPGFGVSNVSQKTAAVSPNCILHGLEVLVGPVLVRLAEQEAVVPPVEPVHDHDQGPEPETDEEEPVVQKLVVGTEETVVPLAEPQAPLRAAVRGAVSPAALPPNEFAPALVTWPPLELTQPVLFPVTVDPET